MPGDKREGVWDIKRGDRRARGAQRNAGALGAAGKAKTGGWTGWRRERVNTRRQKNKRRQPALFTCDAPEGDGDGGGAGGGWGCYMKRACEKI